MNMRQLNRRFDQTRRQFFHVAGVLSAATLAPRIPIDGFEDTSCTTSLPSTFSGLKPLGERVRPITPDEFRRRIERAQHLMAGAPLSPSGSPSQAAKYDALFFAPGTSLYYFTGVRWGLSERLVGLVIPRVGHPVLVVPAFEEGRLREKLHLPIEVRIWQEDQSPTKIAAAALADQSIRTGRIGIEETTAFTFFDHLHNAAPGFEYASADP
jgi:Xaa-Pro dipeptidase